MKKLTLFVAVLLLVSRAFSQSEFKMSSKFPCVGCYNSSELNDVPNARLDAIKEIEYSRLSEVFREIVANSEIEFNYPQAACQQRTQYLSMLLTKKYKVEHFRVWLFSPSNLYQNRKELLEIDDPNGLLNEKITWAYHVAPAVKSNGKIYVIDPSLDMQKPMLLEDWFKPIGNSKISEYSFLNSEFYFFNRNRNANGNFTNINGYFYRFEGLAKDNLLVEKGLAVNDTAMTIYRKYLLPLKKSNKEIDNQNFNELKKIFGNYSTLEKFLLTNTDRQFYNEYAHIYTKYNEISDEAVKTYLTRLIFWTKKTNELLNMK